jgi:hypothetical protein
MNNLQTLFILLLAFSADTLSAQMAKTNRLLIPFFDPSSQSNVVVSVSEFGGHSQLCPLEETNLVANTNLFTSHEQQLLREVFVKYRSVTTNTGPPGSILVSLDKTNCVVPIINKTNSYWRAVFEYTNSGAQDEVIFVLGNTARFQGKDGDGYIVGFGNEAAHVGMVFEETKFGVANGLHVDCIDIQKVVGEEGIVPSEFARVHVATYRHMTNGLAIGKFLMWNPGNNNLILKAEFKEPYDLNKNRVSYPLQ